MKNKLDIQDILVNYLDLFLPEWMDHFSLVPKDEHYKYNEKVNSVYSAYIYSLDRKKYSEASLLQIKHLWEVVLDDLILDHCKTSKQELLKQWLPPHISFDFEKNENHKLFEDLYLNLGSIIKAANWTIPDDTYALSKEWNQYLKTLAIEGFISRDGKKEKNNFGGWLSD